MSDGGGGILLGLVIGFFIWGNEHGYIENVKSDEKSEWGESYILSKVGSGQVAVIHGFVDDLDVCLMMRERLERDGGYYACSQALNAEGPVPWWRFW